MNNVIVLLQSCSRDELESPHSRSHQPLWQRFPPVTVNTVWPVTLTFEHDLDSVKMNQSDKYLGQRSCRS